MESYFPMKTSDSRLADVTKYGGQKGVAVSGYSLLEYKVNGKECRSLEALPILLGHSELLSEEMILNYFQKVLETENKKKTVTDLRICIKMIPRGSLIKYDGFYYYLGGKTNNDSYILSAVQVCFSWSVLNYIKRIDTAIKTNYYSEKSHGKVIIDRESNLALYKKILDKYENTIFKNKKGTVSKILADGLNIFENLSCEEQCKVLQMIMTNFQMGSKMDLSLINGGANCGITKINKKISNVSELKLIYQSVTGIYSREINLLTV